MSGRAAFLVAAAALALVAVGSRDAAACSCVPATEAEHRAAADAVFEGRVVAIDGPRRGRATTGSADALAATVAITSVVKGSPGGRLLSSGLCQGSRRLAGPSRTPEAGGPPARVVTARSSASCGLDLQPGETWRFYADAREPDADFRPPPSPSGGIPPGGGAADWLLEALALAAAALGLGAAALVATRARRRRRPR